MDNNDFITVCSAWWKRGTWTYLEAARLLATQHPAPKLGLGLPGGISIHDPEHNFESHSVQEIIALAKSFPALRIEATPMDWLRWAESQGLLVPEPLAKLCGMQTTANIFKPIPRITAQDMEILSAIREHGFDPKKLPKERRGSTGPRSVIRKALQRSALFVGSTVFNKAWQRLRDSGEIADDPSSK